MPHSAYRSGSGSTCNSEIATCVNACTESGSSSCCGHNEVGTGSSHRTRAHGHWRARSSQGPHEVRHIPYLCNRPV